MEREKTTKDKKENGTEKKAKTAKTERQLADEFVAKVEKIVQKLDWCYERILKSTKARKYKMSDEEKSYILQYTAKAYEKFAQRMQGTVEAKPVFHLKQT